MFPGSGEKGFPKPWGAAARHHGWRDPDDAPRYYCWGDADGDGEMDPEEFRFFELQGDLLKIGSMGCYDRDLSFRKPRAGPGEPEAFYVLPRTGWTGPRGDVPVWSWDRIESVGLVPEDSTDWPSMRSMATDDDGNLYAAIQSGLMIREHGQYEGGRWPCQSIRRARLAKWSRDGRLRFSVGRHSKTPGEIGTGVLYCPVQIVLGPHDTVVVSDQIY